MARGREGASAGRLSATKEQRARQTSDQREVAQNAWNALHAAGPARARSRTTRRTAREQTERRRTGRRSRTTKAATGNREQGTHDTSARRQQHEEDPHRTQATGGPEATHRSEQSPPAQKTAQAGRPVRRLRSEQPNGTRGKELIRRTEGNAWSERVPESSRAAPTAELGQGCRTRTCGRHCVPNA
ncbi:hypothetical protein ERJ75_000541300 [Trypanosoma vivax]|nr:hypothetical protein ERJ75_000541300 [Trypanosoma vivax]